MRKIKEEFRHLDYIFAHATDITDLKCLELIAVSYETAREGRPLIAELARKRYRDREHRYKTCRQLFISEAQYYKLLKVFLRIAKAVEETLNSDQPKHPPAT